MSIETVKVDFGSFDLNGEAYERVVSALDGKDVGVLVNNVGYVFQRRCQCLLLFSLLIPLFFLRILSSFDAMQNWLRVPYVVSRALR